MKKRMRDYSIFPFILLAFILLILSSCVDYKEIHSISSTVQDLFLIVKKKIILFLALPTDSTMVYTEYLDKTISNFLRSVFTMLTGGALAVAGVSFQSLFKNPLVSPGIMGVSSGTNLGIALGLIFFNAYSKSLPLYILAYLFGFGSVAIVLVVTFAIGKGKIHIPDLILLGIVLSSFYSALFSILVQSIQVELIAQINIYLMGAIYIAPPEEEFVLYIIIITVCIVPLVAYRYQMNALALGQEEAQSMGVNTIVLPVVIILCGTMLNATTVIFCGSIGWIGIVIPFIGRILHGPDYKKLLVACFVLGAIFLLIAEDLSILLGYFPLGIITSIIGAPVFFILLKRKGGRSFDT